MVAVTPATGAKTPFNSGVMPGTGTALNVSLDVSGRKWLRLTSTVKKGAGNCHIWGEATLYGKDGSTNRLADIKPQSVKVGWGKLLTNENWQKHPLKIGDRQFEHGVWVHGNSDVLYKLDGKYRRFESWVGLDADRPTGAAQFAVTFDKAKPKPVRKPPPPIPIVKRERLEAERDREFASLSRDIGNRGHFAKVAAETYRSQALIHDGDRDPLDVVLRRTAALVDDLGQKTPSRELAEAEEELAKLKTRADAIDVNDKDARRALFDDACHVRRRIAFLNPLLDFDELLFITHHRAIYNHMCDQYYGIVANPGGGLYVLSNPFGDSPEVRDVLAESVVERGRLKGQKLTGGSKTPPRLRYNGHGTLTGDDHDGGTFLSPDLSYDGETILFSFAEGRGDKTMRMHTDPSQGRWHEGRCYHIFKVGVDGSGLEQLTDGTWNDVDPCFLPNGRIAFISERRGGFLRCGRACPLYTLYDMAGDGSDITCLSFHESNEWHPSVTHDGRIIWTRWDYVDRFGCIAHMPWLTTVDGRDPRPLHGNYSPRRARPDMELDCRAIPGSHKYVATAAPHHRQSYGSLIIIDPDIPDDDGMAPVKRFTPEVAFPESQGGREVYGAPWPLSETYHLCVYDTTMQIGTKGLKNDYRPGNYGIYLVDAFGNREPIYRDLEIACLSPIPLRPRPMPPAVPEMVKRGPASDPAARASLPPEERDRPREGIIAVMDVYDSLLPFPDGTKITALRVLKLLPDSMPSGGGKPHETGVRMPSARDSVVPVRHVLGTVPVEKDGSAHFIVPANRSIFFQALDENGLAVQSMRSATYVHDGESLSCIGCHDKKHQTSSPPSERTIALQRPPSRLEPDVEGSNPFSYPLLVQPVLERHCVECHNKEENKKKAPNLNREPIQKNWYASYNSLVHKYGFYNYGNPVRTIPGKFGAHASKLYEMLSKGHNDLKLPPEDMHRITLWLDCVSMFYGVYEKETGLAQLDGKVAYPTLE